MDSFLVIETDRLVLRQIIDSDAEDLYSFRNDAVAERFNSGPKKSLTEASHLIEELARGYEQGTGLHWGVTVRREVLLRSDLLLTRIS